jgi:hypothetical protein
LTSHCEQMAQSRELNISLQEVSPKMETRRANVARESDFPRLLLSTVTGPCASVIYACHQRPPTLAARMRTTARAKPSWCAPNANRENHRRAGASVAQLASGLGTLISVHYSNSNNRTSGPAATPACSSFFIEWTNNTSRRWIQEWLLDTRTEARTCYWTLGTVKAQREALWSSDRAKCWTIRAGFEEGREAVSTRSRVR